MGPSDVAVGRYLWKNANQCNDVNNIARKTQTFDLAEYTDVVRAYNPSGRVLGACANQVEIFISCFDFKITGSSSPSPAPPSQAPCTDENQNCGSWAASGQCEANPAYMLVNCRLSCGVCSPPTQAPAPPTQAPCTDENQNCGNWAASGQCQANPDYMLVNCRSSCGVCSLGAPTQASTAPGGPGLCCHGGCGGGNCQGGWCGESQGNCEGNCNGKFCPAAGLASLKNTKKHV